MSYLSANVDSEFVHLIALEAKKEIISQIHHSKYYSLIIDSTPDVSRVNQLTTIVRYVDDIGLENDRFLQFFENTGHKGIEMKNVVVTFLKKDEVEMRDCRGQ